MAETSHTATGIPLIGYDDLDLKDAQAVPLISVLADIIEATCVLPTAVPTTHAEAARGDRFLHATGQSDADRLGQLLNLLRRQPCYGSLQRAT